jgi:lysophospholipase L1-like esterase
MLAAGVAFLMVLASQWGRTLLPTPGTAQLSAAPPPPAARSAAQAEAPGACRSVSADIGFGVLGDSNSDEYRADDARGGAFAATTLSWVEQLAQRRGLNFGPWGAWGEPRRTGYAYNWSRTGATTDDMIRAGQHTGLAEQIAAGHVQYVIVQIGVNDFQLWSGGYAQIYDGSLSGAALAASLDRIVENYTAALDTLRAAGNIRLIVTSMLDMGQSPEVIASHPVPDQRRRVSRAIDQVNGRLAALAAERGVPLVDINSFGRDLLKQREGTNQLLVAGIPIDLQIPGNDPRHFRLADGAGHPGTIASSLMANELVVRPLREHFGLCIEPFSEREMLDIAGIGASR